MFVLATCLNSLAINETACAVKLQGKRLTQPCDHV